MWDGFLIQTLQIEFILENDDGLKTSESIIYWADVYGGVYTYIESKLSKMK